MQKVAKRPLREIVLMLKTQAVSRAAVTHTQKGIIPERMASTRTHREITRLRAGKFLRLEGITKRLKMWHLLSVTAGELKAMSGEAML